MIQRRVSMQTLVIHSSLYIFKYLPILIGSSVQLPFWQPFWGNLPETAGQEHRRHRG